MRCIEVREVRVRQGYVPVKLYDFHPHKMAEVFLLVIQLTRNLHGPQCYWLPPIREPEGPWLAPRIAFAFPVWGRRTLAFPLWGRTILALAALGEGRILPRWGRRILALGALPEGRTLAALAPAAVGRLGRPSVAHRALRKDG